MPGEKLLPGAAGGSAHPEWRCCYCTDEMLWKASLSQATVATEGRIPAQQKGTGVRRAVRPRAGSQAAGCHRACAPGRGGGQEKCLQGEHEGSHTAEADTEH